jgi:hypothetical protein
MARTEASVLAPGSSVASPEDGLGAEVGGAVTERGVASKIRSIRAARAAPSGHSGASECASAATLGSRDDGAFCRACARASSSCSGRSGRRARAETGASATMLARMPLFVYPDQGKAPVHSS